MVSIDTPQESDEFVAYLKSQRTMTEAEAWAAERAHDAYDIPAEERYSALAH